MKNTLMLTYLLLVMLTVSCSQQEQHLPDEEQRERFDTELSNQRVSSFCEDSKGHIWIGTQRGVNKYNTYGFQQFFHTEDSTTLADNQIRNVYCDKQGRQWITTVNGVCIYTDKGNFKQIPIHGASTNVRGILEDKQGNIYLNMVVDFCKYDSVSQAFESTYLFNFESAQKASFSNICLFDDKSNLWSIRGAEVTAYDTRTWKPIYKVNAPAHICYAYLQNNRYLWLSAGQGLHRFDVLLRKFVELPEGIQASELNRVRTNCIHPYNNGLLFATTDGVFYYNPTEKSVSKQGDADFPFTMPRSLVQTFFTDSQKNLWIGFINQGFITIYDYQKSFNTDNYLTRFFDHKDVVSLTPNSKGQIWVNTYDEGLFLYDNAAKQIRKINVRFNKEQNGFDPGFKTCLRVDAEDNLWIAYGFVLVKTHLVGDELVVDKTYPSTAPLMSLTFDDEGNAWCGRFDENISVIRKGPDAFSIIPLYKKDYTFTTCILALQDGNLFVASLNQNPVFLNKKGEKIGGFNINDSIKVSKFIANCALEDSRRHIWIGTYANGLFRYDPSTKEVRRMPKCSCEDISSIEEDKQGNIWVSTFRGLCMYDYSTDRFINYYTNDGIGGNQFDDQSSCRLPDGTLYFGGTHGITNFSPINIYEKKKVPVLFESLKIHNQTIHPYNSASIDKELVDNPQVRLKADQNSFTLSFAAIDYSEFERVRYAYILEGFDKFWTEGSTNHEVTYSNLPAGCYTFKVRISNNDKSIIEAENELHITVEPPLTLTWWALTLYFLLFCALVYGYIYLRMRVQKNKLMALQAQYQMEQEQRTNKMNSSFFANISHEFRTPLTMILGPINNLCEDKSLNGDTRQMLLIIQRSANRMLRLVNQLLDFNKLDNDALKLSVKEQDVISILKREMEVFQINATNRQIQFNAHGLEGSFFAYADVDKIEKILSNLLSNAFKYSPVGGKVDVFFDVITENNIQKIRISVANNGDSIPDGEQEKIFERYYQLNRQATGAYNYGTGIGLYYCKQLVHLHHGVIGVNNLPEGGVDFFFTLPVNRNSYTADELENEQKQTTTFPIISDEEYQKKSEAADDEKPRILVVDDDSEVVHYLQVLLSPIYHVICCFDAESALQRAHEDSPDLIVTDVAMPGMDGLELCRHIKEELDSSHLPVVLVTAKTASEDVVKGVGVGADTYITKPFDPAVLKAVISAQLQKREKVRELLNNATKTDEIEQNTLSAQDNAFMTELYELMEKEMTYGELNVNSITESMHLSRAKFYYKVKGLTGETPNNFFKTYKLNRAAKLLKEGNYNVSEVADMTGFSTLPHFSASFKKKFGVTPSDYK